MTELRDIPILELIPQRPPFVMVDCLTSCDATDAATEFTVRADNIFLDDGLLASAGVIENMAQSCAARIGYLNSLQNQPVKIGFIGDIHNFSLTRQPALNDQLTTSVHIVEDVMNLTLAQVVTKVGDETVASAMMKIATIEKVDDQQTKADS